LRPVWSALSFAEMDAPTRIELVSLDGIDRNPCRDFSQAPVGDAKVRRIIAHFRAYGEWPEKWVGRRKNNRIQLACGHHQLAAACQLGLSEITVEIRDLNKLDMVRWMAKQHGEHARPDFLTNLFAYRAFVKIFSQRNKGGTTLSDIAREFGWTDPNPGHSMPRPNIVALACAKCSEAIDARVAKMQDFAGMRPDRARQSAIVRLTREGSQGLHGFLPKEQRGRTKKIIIETRAAKASRSRRPFRYHVEAENIGVLERDVDWLVRMINDLLEPDEVSEEGGPGIGVHLDDLVRSGRHLQGDAERGQLAKVSRALGELFLRASTWQERLVGARDEDC
jgi:hypothetical protein